MSTPAISSIAESLETIAFCFEQRQRAERHRDGEHRRHGHGNRGDHQDQHELQDGERVRHAPIIGDDEIAIDLDRDQHDRERDRDDDEEIADLEHGLLRMAHRAGAGDEVRGAAEESVGAGRRDDADHLALLDDAAGIGGVADLLGDGQRLARQRRLVDRGVIAGNEPQIGRHDDAQPDLRQCRRVRARLRAARSTRRRAARWPPARGPSSAPRARWRPCDPARIRARR